MSSTAPHTNQVAAARGNRPVKPRFHRRAAMAAALALACAALPLQAAEPPKAVKDNERQLSELRARMQALNKQLQSDRGQQDELRTQIEAAEQKIAGMSGQLKTLREDIRRQGEAVAAAEAQRKAAEQRLEEARGRLANQLRAAYVTGQKAHARIALERDDAAGLGRALTYFDYLARARSEQMAKVQQEVQELAALEERLREGQARLESLQLERRQVLGGLQASREERRGMMQKVASRIEDQSDQLKQLRASEDQLQKVLKALRDALAKAPPSDSFDGSDKSFSQLRGKLPWPIRGPVIADYGMVKAGSGGHLTWSGRWIGAPEGTQVRAVAKGRVAYVGWLQRYGQMVIVEHAGGYYSLYGHNASVTCRAGDAVDMGEVISTAGDSGGHEKTGVYLEFRKGSTPLNPKDWLKP